MKEYSFSGYFSRLLIIAILYIGLPIIFSVFFDDSTRSSYIGSSLCFLFLTIVASKLLFEDSSYTRFFLVAYIIQIVLGLVHYLTFIDPNYFYGNGNVKMDFHDEMEQTFMCVQNLVEFKKSNGLFNSDDPSWWVAHKYIWNIISIPLYFTSVKWMNLGPISTFFLLFGSMNLIVISKYQNYNNDIIKKIKYITAYFPAFILNDSFTRDPSGIGLISIGLVLYVLSKNNLQRIIAVTLAVYFCFVQRTMYPVAFVAAFGFAYIFNIKNSYGKFFCLAIVLPITLFLYGNLESLEGDSYSSGYLNQASFLFLPIKIVFGFIGPFPWTGFLNHPIFSYQLADHFQGVLQLGMLLCIISNFRVNAFKNNDIVLWFGILLLFSGILTTYMHISYIAFGVFFILPWFINNYSKVFDNYIKRSFWILIGLNIIIIMFGNFGLSSLWR